ncbi:S-adenosylmethionine--2-demethylmenaquinone methyltransferase [Arcobacter sp. F155]|uniref:ribonuclease E activity regulator RraA n=1 Tax=Arcobacter sp. F155 TaxID=2044512 RepID=UPI00100C255C|nr:ribonuclease E activity regulator RraA [Arcobacter sp. F155]RXJ78066.1 S-adenosylmethionine--2-demethylmenaquinone methyltransferase [Arcobacter sp. F155]
MRKFKTADLCDENQDKNIQVLSSKFKNFGGKKIFQGEVKTVKLNKSNWSLIDILNKSDGLGKVLVVDVQGEYYAVVGDKLSFLAEKANYEAMIINGYVRDTMETKKFNIGLLALGTCPLRSFEKTNGKIGVNLTFENVSFKENNYIYCDEDGVIVLDKKL